MQFHQCLLFRIDVFQDKPHQVELLGRQAPSAFLQSLVIGFRIYKVISNITIGQNKGIADRLRYSTS